MSIALFHFHEFYFTWITCFLKSIEMFKIMRQNLLATQVFTSLVWVKIESFIRYYIISALQKLLPLFCTHYYAEADTKCDHKCNQTSFK